MNPKLQRDKSNDKFEKSKHDPSTMKAAGISTKLDVLPKTPKSEYPTENHEAEEYSRTPIYLENQKNQLSARSRTPKMQDSSILKNGNDNNPKNNDKADLPQSIQALHSRSTNNQEDQNLYPSRITLTSTRSSHIDINSYNEDDFESNSIKSKKDKYGPVSGTLRPKPSVTERIQESSPINEMKEHQYIKKKPHSKMSSISSKNNSENRQQFIVESDASSVNYSDYKPTKLSNKSPLSKNKLETHSENSHKQKIMLTSKDNPFNSVKKFNAVTAYNDQFKHKTIDPKELKYAQTASKDNLIIDNKLKIHEKTTYSQLYTAPFQIKNSNILKPAGKETFAKALTLNRRSNLNGNK